MMAGKNNRKVWGFTITMDDVEIACEEQLSEPFHNDQTQRFKVDVKLLTECGIKDMREQINEALLIAEEIERRDIANEDALNQARLQELLAREG